MSFVSLGIFYIINPVVRYGDKVSDVTEGYNESLLSFSNITG